MVGTLAIAANTNYSFIPDETFVMPAGRQLRLYKLDNYSDPFDRSFAADHKRVEFLNRVTLFVYKTVSDRALQAQYNEFYLAYSASRDREMRDAWVDYWSKVALGAVVPPLVLLMLGAALGWIFAGFSRRQHS